ncbi:hypothetical protein DFH08DRAFT_881779 [Mycena albidolilacea]|uniref:Uncharacterized protein n=1 Tax=Mycena albidolilacea TaxID=1033008 RepID=A0AAD6ZQF3_9AGAR|nr:hypothetical protein DFH08DRAFT_881779 [Mycena albidolilacea]
MKKGRSGTAISAGSRAGVPHAWTGCPIAAMRGFWCAQLVSFRSGTPCETHEDLPNPEPTSPVPFLLRLLPVSELPSSPLIIARASRSRLNASLSVPSSSSFPRERPATMAHVPPHAQPHLHPSKLKGHTRTWTAAAHAAETVDDSARAFRYGRRVKAVGGRDWGSGRVLAHSMAQARVEGARIGNRGRKGEVGQRCRSGMGGADAGCVRPPPSLSLSSSTPPRAPAAPAHDARRAWSLRIPRPLRS